MNVNVRGRMKKIIREKEREGNNGKGKKEERDSVTLCSVSLLRCTYETGS
jgi:hypothetical protein